MANYTIQIYDMLNILYTEKETYDLDKKIEFCKNIVIQSNDTFFTELPNLKEKMLRHYMFHEIGFDTIQRFIFEINNTVNEKLPYYKEMLKTLKLDYMNLNNIDVSESVTENESATGTGKSSNKGNSSNTSNGDNDSNTINISAEAPVDFVRNLYAPEYATHATKNTDDSTYRSNGTATSTGSGESSTSGERTRGMVNKKTGRDGMNTTAEIVEKIRSAIINIEYDFIMELKTNFMIIY